MDDVRDGTKRRGSADGPGGPHPAAGPVRVSLGLRPTVLIVDDEPDICDLVGYNLAREGYRVARECDGEAGLNRVFVSPPDLLILDLLLPKMSGLEVLGAIRGEPRTRGLPVLLLSARSAEKDRLLGFERGADDYMTKPFSPKELVARVAAILRRSRGEQAGMPVKVGPLEFDAERHRVLIRDRELDVTSTEYKLLECMAQRPGCVFSRQQLLDKIWGIGYLGGTRTVDVHVGRLRAKLARDADLIRTVMGVGYAVEIVAQR